MGGCAILLVLVVVGLVGCAAIIGNTGKTGAPAPGAPSAGNSKGNGPVVVRVSGTSGLAYSGSYGSVSGGQRSVDGTVGGGRDRYEVSLRNGGFDSVSATFQKKEPQGSLEVEIIQNTRTVARQETNAQYGVVSVSWSPQ